MKKIREFKCPGHGVFDELAEDNMNTASCPACGCDSPRIMSVPNFKLEGVSGDFPTAADKWANDHEKRARKAKQEQETLKRWGE